MVSRVAGRLITGPGAFFVAGVIDVSVLLFAYLRWRVAGRRATGPT
ncbi:MAG TPA: hypothetical protein VMG37_17810 [Solirubrobacteraceae bacterium]|nr:hypothetical protein [Solirubrobacteraceae bacterium]